MVEKLQKMTYVIWGIVILHLALLDGFRPFDGPQGDGDPVFHDRFYQILAISLPLVILRLPPVKRWVIEKRHAGEQWKVWTAIAPMAVLYFVAFAFIVNEEFFTGNQVMFNASAVELTGTDGRSGAPPQVVAGLLSIPHGAPRTLA